MCDNDKYHITEFRLRYLFGLNKLFGSLSPLAKKYFHPSFIKRNQFDVKWFLAQLALCFSTFPVTRKLLCGIFPRAVYFPLLALNTNNEPVAFSFLKYTQKYSGRKWEAVFGIVVGDDWRGKHLGSSLMVETVRSANCHGIGRIILVVLPENKRAIRLYEKYNFRVKGNIKGADHWQGEDLDLTEMALEL